MDKIWLIELAVPKKNIESFMDYFEEFELVDSLTCFEDEKNDQIWTIQGYKQHTPNEELIEKSIKNLADLNKIPQPTYTLSKIDDIDWVAQSQKNFTPVQAGKFFIHPSWEQNIPNDVIQIKIDPQRAFGTGGHETTKGCIIALQKLEENFKFNNILDMGCGSGILAIAAAKIWNNAQILCADNDPVCIDTTIQNAQNNNVNVNAIISDGYNNKTIKDKSKYDLITSNILAAPLIEFANSAANSLNKNGIIIMAGLLKKDKKEVINAHINCGLSQIASFEINDWSIITMKKD